MIRIAITAAAFEALAAMMPLGNVNYERERRASGAHSIRLGWRTVDKLKAARYPGREGHGRRTEARAEYGLSG